MTSFACCAYDSKNRAFTGGANSNVYIWEGRNLLKTIPNAHKGGFVCAMRCVEGKVYSGGKDGNVTVINEESLEIEK